MSEAALIRRCLDSIGHQAWPLDQQAWDDELAFLQRRMQTTVWITGGCASWYIDSKGRNSALWPGLTWPFRRRTARFDPAAYTFRPPGRGAAAA